MAQHLKYVLSPAAIILFHNAFFDTLALSRSRLKVAVHERVRLAVMRGVTHPEDEVAARRAITADARSVAVSMPGTALAWSAVLMSAGYNPGRRELVDIVGQMESLAVVRAGESLLRGAPGDEGRAAAFVHVLEKIHAIRETIVTPESQLTKQLHQFQLAHAVKPMVTMAELQARGDDVTVDIGPVPAADEDEGTELSIPAS